MNNIKLYGLILSNIKFFSQRLFEIRDSVMPATSNCNHNVFPKDYLRIKNGVKIVSGLQLPSQIIDSNNFIFDVTNKNVITEMMKLGIPLYKIDSCNSSGDYFCNISYIQIVLKNFSSEIFGIHAPNHSIPISLLEYYLKTVENHLELIKRKTLLNGSIVYFILEEIGIKEYGAFAYKGIYKAIVWDFDYVEKFKDRLCWKHLIEDSNLKWDECKLNQYYSFIPFNKEGNRYAEIFKEELTISDFSNIGILSNHFIQRNYRNINLEKFLETAYFKWNGDDLRNFHNLIATIDITWGTFHDTTAGEQISLLLWYYLCKNKRFNWTPELLKSTFEIKGNFNDFLSMEESVRIKMVPIFSNTFKYYSRIGEEFDTHLFLIKLIEGRNLPFDSYSIYFTVKNIKQNWNNWNRVLTNKFVHSHRLSRDTWFYVYQVKTMWNYFNENEYVMLTYDLCKVLLNKKIIIGGEYEKEYENQKDIDSGFITKEVNALEYFGKHPISSDEEIEKIMENNDLLVKLLSNGNETLINFILNRFFSNYPPQEFFKTLELLNQ